MVLVFPMQGSGAGAARDVIRDRGRFSTSPGAAPRRCPRRSAFARDVAAPRRGVVAAPTQGVERRADRVDAFAHLAERLARWAEDPVPDAVEELLVLPDCLELSLRPEAMRGILAQTEAIRRRAAAYA
jgi:hypothetical protein